MKRAFFALIVIFALLLPMGAQASWSPVQFTGAGVGNYPDEVTWYSHAGSGEARVEVNFWDAQGNKLPSQITEWEMYEMHGEQGAGIEQGAVSFTFDAYVDGLLVQHVEGPLPMEGNPVTWRVLLPLVAQ